MVIRGVGPARTEHEPAVRYPPAKSLRLGWLSRVRVGSVVQLVACAAFVLAGCETATDIKNTVVEAAEESGSFISTESSHAADFIMGRKSGLLQDDGTPCFSTARLPFYAAVDEITEAQRLKYGAMVGTAVATFAAFYAKSTLAKLAAVGFGATMVAVIADIQADRARITKVNETFGALVKCRQREAGQINQDYGRRKLDRSAAEDRLANLRKLMAEDVEAAQGVNAILTARNDGYVLTTKQTEQQAPPAKDRKEVNERTQQAKKAEAAIQTNQKALAQQTASIRQAQALSGADGFSLSWLAEPWLRLAELDGL